MRKPELEELLEQLSNPNEHITIDMPTYTNEQSGNTSDQKISFPEWVPKVWPEQYDVCNVKVVYNK
jgi:hypothetical protein